MLVLEVVECLLNKHIHKKADVLGLVLKPFVKLRLTK